MVRIMSQRLLKIKSESSLGLIFTGKINLQELYFCCLSIVLSQFPFKTNFSISCGGVWVLHAAEVAFLCCFVNFCFTRS